MEFLDHHKKLTIFNALVLLEYVTNLGIKLAIDEVQLIHNVIMNNTNEDISLYDG